MNLEALESVIKPCGLNVPGVAKLELVESCYVLCIPPVVGGEITEDIILHHEAKVATWEFTKGTARYQEKRKQHSAHGDYYDKSLILELAKDRALLTWLHYSMRNTLYSLVYTDNNGVKKFLHRFKNSSRLNTQRSSGRNGYEWEFRRESKEPSPVFSGNWI